jgi:hypothetical protein
MARERRGECLLKETDIEPNVKTAPVSPTIGLSIPELIFLVVLFVFAALPSRQIFQKRKGVFSQQYPGSLQVSPLQ